MKVLLLSDVPPCREWTAGIVLDQLCRFLPRGSIACFSVLAHKFEAKLSPDLEHLPVEYARGPRQTVPAVRPKAARNALSLAMSLADRATSIPRLVRRAVAFGKQFQPDLLWVTLEGQNLIQMALPVAERLGVPMVTQVFDPPHWWLRAGGVDGLSSRSILRHFDDAVKRSACCAAASWAMAEEYSREYGVRAVPLIPSLDERIAELPATAPHQDGRFVIGIAGQLYATAEWESLTAALHSVSWKIAGRHVTIRLLGRYAQLAAKDAMRIEFLGWRPQPETVRLLSEADALYCPYWFDPAYQREARLSFPSKLTSYLAAGRPVLFHGPAYASPARFLKQHHAGLCCHSLEPSDVVGALEALAEDAGIYRRLAQNGSEAFRSLLTLAPYRRTFAEFLGMDEAELEPIERARLAA